MSTRKPTIICAVLLAVVVAGCSFNAAGRSAASSVAEPAAENPRGAVRRALPYLARQTNAWIETKKCTSCHQVPHALWAMNEAQAGGFAVDDRLSEWNRWSVDFVLRKTDQPEGNEARAQERADEIYQLLLAGSTIHDPLEAGPRDGSETPRNKLIALLHRGQDESESWPAGGRLPDQKRPKQETNEVTTMWVRHTLQAAGDRAGEHRVGAPRTRPGGQTQSTSVEHLVLRYLLALDDPAGEQTSALQEQILSHQNADGGWGWLLGGASDAMATGQALYGLSHMEPQHRCEAVGRAHQFLLRTQQPDGSWHVPSTLREGDGQPYEVSNDWGTAWAVIGLMRTLGS